MWEMDRLTLFKRFWKAPPPPLHRAEVRRPLTKLGERINSYLTIAPTEIVLLSRPGPEDPNELINKQRSLYTEARNEFQSDPPEVIAAWLQRKRHESDWIDTDEYRRTK